MTEFDDIESVSDLQQLVEEISIIQTPSAQVDKLMQIFRSSMSDEEVIVLDILLTGSRTEIRELEDCLWELLGLEDVTESLISLHDEFMDRVVTNDLLTEALAHVNKLLDVRKPEEAEHIIDNWLEILNLEWQTVD